MGLKSLFLFLLMVWMGGCVHQELIPPDQTSNLTHPTPSASTVDISDLNTTVQTSTPSPKTFTTVSRIPFPIAEYRQLAKKGTGSIKGQIYIITPNGQRVVGRNTRLYLNPVTSYSRQWYQQSYLGGKKLSKADPRLYNYLRFTASDSSGNFSFFGIPSGRYYLIGTVRCKDECGYSSTKNIRIAREVEVLNGQSITVNLSKNVN